MPSKNLDHKTLLVINSNITSDGAYVVDIMEKLFIPWVIFPITEYAVKLQIDSEASENLVNDWCDEITTLFKRNQLVVSIGGPDAIHNENMNNVFITFGSHHYDGYKQFLEDMEDIRLNITAFNLPSYRLELERFQKLYPGKLIHNTCYNEIINVVLEQIENMVKLHTTMFHLLIHSWSYINWFK
jgi:hypothetical protein